jgi:hypothetical protein
MPCDKNKDTLPPSFVVMNVKSKKNVLWGIFVKLYYLGRQSKVGTTTELPRDLSVRELKLINMARRKNVYH